MGCQKEEEFIENTSSINTLEESENYGEYKEIYYQGFLVNHRFTATEEELKQEYSKENL
ncbi:hypothetical protein [uncultured Polaribacter sp.]|uniref:hypothetical protein n=1 Tax=uncultured Polaribacter sp. TaxID=174711 RepID=UPI00260FF17C|nr:hypothetical protein [uncultured Polaribacter sp.]